MKDKIINEIRKVFPESKFIDGNIIKVEHNDYYYAYRANNIINHNVPSKHVEKYIKSAIDEILRSICREIIKWMTLKE